MSEEIRVAQISTVHPTFDPRIFQKICVSLSRKGYSVNLVIPHDCRENVDGVNIIPLKRVRLRAVRIIVMPLVATLKALRLRADIYHFHDPELLPWAWLLRVFGKKVIYDMHEYVPAAILHKDWLHPRFRVKVSRLWQRMERLLIAKISLVVAEKSYLEYYGWHDDVEVVQNFPRVELLATQTADKEAVTTLVYVGHVHESRGSKIMLRVASKLCATGSRIKLLYIGFIPPQHQKELSSLAKSMGVELDCTGRLPPKEAWLRVSRCHIGFALLAPEPNYLGSYPTKMFEYMAMGLPAVVSNFPLYRDVIDRTKGGAAVDPTDVDAIFETTRPFVEDPELCREVGETGRRAVEQYFNWQVEEAKLYDLYDRMSKKAG